MAQRQLWLLGIPLGILTFLTFMPFAHDHEGLFLPVIALSLYLVCGGAVNYLLDK